MISIATVSDTRISKKALFQVCSREAALYAASCLVGLLTYGLLQRSQF